MVNIKEKINLDKLKEIENVRFFEDMMKAVVDIEKEEIAVNAELHSDLEQYLLESGSSDKNLYGINILFDEKEIEFDSLINPPRNREAGYPRAGRTVADPAARQKIEEIVNKWIEM